MAIPAEMAQFLNLKYANMAKQAEAGLISAQAGMLNAQGASAKDFAQAGVIPGTAAAEIGLRNAQAQNQIADAGRSIAQTGEIPLNDASTRAYQGSAAGKNIADTAFTGERTIAAQGLNRFMVDGSGLPTAFIGTGAGMPAAPKVMTPAELQNNSVLNPVFGATPVTRPMVGERLGPGMPATTPIAEEPKKRGGAAVYDFAKGTAKVPGKGDGTKDTVKAKLAPGEAVLNKSAAEELGRGLIAALNQVGAHKMGLA